MATDSKRISCSADGLKSLKLHWLCLAEPMRRVNYRDGTHDYLCNNTIECVLLNALVDRGHPSLFSEDETIIYQRRRYNLLLDSLLNADTCAVSALTFLVLVGAAGLSVEAVIEFVRALSVVVLYRRLGARFTELHCSGDMFHLFVVSMAFHSSLCSDDNSLATIRSDHRTVRGHVQRVVANGHRDLRRLQVKTTFCRWISLNLNEP